LARRSCTFRQRDLTAAIKAARAAGIDPRVEIDRITGNLIITQNVAQPRVVTDSADEPAGEEKNPWD
jgi:hypothetical protein